jgi:hypothetical protein
MDTLVTIAKQTKTEKNTQGAAIRGCCCTQVENGGREKFHTREQLTLMVLSFWGLVDKRTAVLIVVVLLKQPRVHEMIMVQ